jgi:predicted nucleotide-binding protein
MDRRMVQKNRKTTDSKLERTQLTVNVSDAETQLQTRIAKGALLLESLPTAEEMLDQAKKSYYTWSEYNTALLKRLFSTEELSKEYSFWGIAFAGPNSFQEKVREFAQDVKVKIRRLESIVERLPLYSADTMKVAHSSDPTSVSTASRKVFVVHGRNNELKETVARYLAVLDLKPIILHEQASAGQTIIEKFERHSDSSFAVILLTPDDVGALSSADSIAELSKRARQNVVFEWGYFVARLGRRNVCALVAEGVELPSDMQGIVYLTLDQGGAWKTLLARELKAGNIEIDLNLAI